MRSHLPGILCRGHRRQEEAKLKAETDRKKKLQKEAEEKNVAGSTDVSMKTEGTATTGEEDRAVEQMRKWAAEQRPRGPTGSLQSGTPQSKSAPEQRVRGPTGSQQSREPSPGPAADAAPKSSGFDPLEEFFTSRPTIDADALVEDQKKKKAREHLRTDTSDEELLEPGTCCPRCGSYDCWAEADTCLRNDRAELNQLLMIFLANLDIVECTAAPYSKEFKSATDPRRTPC